MKIIIAGAGSVGTHLAELLSKENQDIVVVDENPDKTEALSSSDYDLMTLNVSPTSIAGLKEAGVPHADLFIAVTPAETTNVTCCALAHTLGAKKTVARVDNWEWMQPAAQEHFKGMGIDSLIYPETLASAEIIEGLKRSWARQYWEVHGGALVMLGVKLREEAVALYGKPLKKLCDAETPYHIVAVKRDEQTIIPTGDTELLKGDIAYFMTTKKHIQTIRQLVGKENYADVKDVMVMGGGSIAFHVIRNRPENMRLKVIEMNEARCQRLSELLDAEDAMIIQGDGRDTHLLLDEGIRGMQAFCALTPNAENNILACLAAKRLGVRKTVAQVENMEYVSLAEKLDIGTIINKKTIAASHIYRMMMNTDVASLHRLTIANADVAEFIAQEGSEITKDKISEMSFPRGVTLGGLVRDGVGLPISGNTQIKAGDIVVVFSLAGLIQEMDHYFAAPTSVISRLKSALIH
ncbi:MAG: Trk system potassium transporter TrkA [Bacteroidaceae bacterium]|nr:Trk system potassium transporter TrkA [Bacteroidaceae bacterium]